jgi:hypothetical protein
MQSKASNFFRRGDNNGSAVATATSTMSAAVNAGNGALRTLARVGSTIPRRLTSEHLGASQGSFGSSPSHNRSFGSLLVKAWKATDLDGEPTLVCPCKTTEVLKFRSIASRGAAICHICGDMFNGAVIR